MCISIKLIFLTAIADINYKSYNGGNSWTEEGCGDKQGNDFATGNGLIIGLMDNHVKSTDNGSCMTTHQNFNHGQSGVTKIHFLK